MGDGPRDKHPGACPVMDRIACGSPHPAPTLPDVAKYTLSARWIDHDINRKAEFVVASPRSCNRETLGAGWKTT